MKKDPFLLVIHLIILILMICEFESLIWQTFIRIWASKTTCVFWGLIPEVNTQQILKLCLKQKNKDDCLWQLICSCPSRACSRSLWLGRINAIIHLHLVSLLKHESLSGKLLKLPALKVIKDFWTLVETCMLRWATKEQ